MSYPIEVQVSPYNLIYKILENSGILTIEKEKIKGR
jgi:hypothetical protein